MKLKYPVLTYSVLCCVQCAVFLYSWVMWGRFEFHKVVQPSPAITPSVRPGQHTILGLGWLTWGVKDRLSKLSEMSWNGSTLFSSDNQEKVRDWALALPGLTTDKYLHLTSGPVWLEIISLPPPDLKCNFHFPSLVEAGRRVGSHVMSTPW